MRLAFISDIHANLVALQTVLQDIDKEAVDQIICLGDIIDCGPQPEDVIRLLQDRNIECIAGNHDPLNEHPNNPQLREIEVWTEKQLSQESKDFLANLPSRRTLQVEQSKVLCVHGSPHRVTDQVLEDTPRETLESWTRNENFDIMVCGHTHVQALRNLDNKTLVNVGSVGMPFVRPLGPPPPRRGPRLRPPPPPLDCWRGFLPPSHSPSLLLSRLIAIRVSHISIPPLTPRTLPAW